MSVNTVADPNWYMDNGASAHITNNLANLDNRAQSYGKEQITVGNSEKLNVKHIGITSLPCKRQNLKLKDVLHAPQVTKNLISLSKLTSDNNILIEFDSYGCYVKDKSTIEVLLKGSIKEGLYEFSNKRRQGPLEQCRLTTQAQENYYRCVWQK